MFRYYLAVMFGGTAGIALFAAFAGGVPIGKAFLAAFSTSAAAFGLDAICALATRWLIPEKKMNPFSRVFRVHRSERRFYVKIGIRRWKDKIPETGGLLVGFSKSAVADRRDNAYLLKFLKETCYAELMHTVSIPFGFLVLLLSLVWNTIPHFIGRFALPVACVNAVLQLLPIFVQRYVRPFLLSAYQWNERHARKNPATENAATENATTDP